MKILALTSHPIQYYAPLYRELTAMPDADLHVVYFSDISIRGGVDSGFGRAVAWDVPLLDGYASSFALGRYDTDRPRLLGVGLAARAIRDHAPDVVVIAGYMFGFELEALAFCKLRGIPVVMRGEFTDARPEYGQLHRLARLAFLRTLYPQVGAFGVIGRGAREHLLASGVPAAKLFSSPYFVDARALTHGLATTTRDALRAELGLASTRSVFLFSGKLIERKGVDMLLRALEAPELANTTTLIVGSGPDDAALRAHASRLPPDRTVTFCGFVNQSQLFRYFGAADVFVLPSRYETWGLVVNEALEFGLPVVVSDHVGCRHDLVVDGLGASYPVDDAPALAAALLRVATLARNARTADGCRALIAPFSGRAAAQGILDACTYATR